MTRHFETLSDGDVLYGALTDAGEAALARLEAGQ